MKALVWHGKEDIRCDTVTDPAIEDDRDAIVKVTSCAICGSDLHLFHNFIPAMLPGDIMGHEMMGEVVETGRGVNGKLKKGDRVVVPFTIICGECDQCKRGNFSVCERTNRKKHLADKIFGHATAGLFGYTHLTGGYPGGQAEYVRVPFADATHIKVPDGIPDEQLLFLGDIFPTGWQAAVQCDIQPTDTVAIWGCGPVGQMAIRSAILLGAQQVVAIDHLPERLSMAEAGTTLYLNGAQLDAEGAATLEGRGVTVEPAKVSRLEGDGHGLSAIMLEDGRQSAIEALYIAPQSCLSSPIAAQLGAEIEEGPMGPLIRTGNDRMTSISGLYAAGDIARAPHSVSWAVADGVTAGTSAHRALVFG